MYGSRIDARDRSFAPCSRNIRCGDRLTALYKKCIPNALSDQISVLRARRGVNNFNDRHCRYPCPRDSRQPRQSDRRGRGHAGQRRGRARGGAVGSLDRGARGGREARRRSEALWRARRARGGRRRQRRDFRRAVGLRCGRPAADRPHADRTRRHAEQEPARRQRRARGQPGLRQGVGDRPGTAALALCRRRLRAHPAGADDEHRQRRRPCRQPDRHPGIHDHAGRRAELYRRDPHRVRKSSTRCAANCTMPGTTPMSATRAGSRRTSPRPTRRCRL